MAFLLDSFVLEHFIYTFVPVIFTGDGYHGLAVSLTIMFFVVWPAKHDTDPLENQRILHIDFIFPLLFGWILGIIFIWALRPPRLINIEIMDEKGKFSILFVLITIGGVMVAASAFFLHKDFEDLNDNAELAIGIILVVIGGLLFLIPLIALTRSKIALPGIQYTNNGRATLMALLYMIVILVTPAIYDFLAPIPSLSKWHGAILLAVIFVLYVLLYPYLLLVNSLSSKFGPRGKNDFFHWRIFYFVLFGGLIHFTYVLVTWIVDIETGDQTKPIVIAGAVVTLIFGIILVIVAIVFPRVKGADSSIAAEMTLLKKQQNLKLDKRY